MNHADQLARVAKLSPAAQVGIYKLRKGIEKWEWLCGDGVKAAEADGWEVIEMRPPPQVLACQHCPRAPF